MSPTSSRIDRSAWALQHRKSQTLSTLVMPKRARPFRTGEPSIAAISHYSSNRQMTERPVSCRCPFETPSKSASPCAEAKGPALIVSASIQSQSLLAIIWFVIGAWRTAPVNFFFWTGKGSITGAKSNEINSRCYYSLPNGLFVCPTTKEIKLKYITLFPPDAAWANRCSGQMPSVEDQSSLHQKLPSMASATKAKGTCWSCPTRERECIEVKIKVWHAPKTGASFHQIGGLKMVGSFAHVSTQLLYSQSPLNILLSKSG